MKRLTTLILALTLLLSQSASAQLYPLFGPSNGIMKGNSGTPQTVAAAVADVLALWSGTCSSSTFLRGDGACAAPPGGATSANPSATIGLSAVNGVAATFMTSDSAPALSQSISPTWTGTHVWSSTGTEFLKASTTSGSLPAYWGFFDSSSNESIVGANGSAGSAEWSNGPTGPQEFVGTLQTNVPITFGTAGFFRLMITGNTASTTAIQAYGPTAATSVDMTPDTGTFTITYTGFTTTVTCTAKWTKMGDIVQMHLCGATGTSNATTMTATGIPTEIQAATGQYVLCGNAENNSVVLSTAGILINTGSTAWSFSVGPGQSVAWTSSNVKGVTNAGCDFSYQLN